MGYKCDIKIMAVPERLSDALALAYSLDLKNEDIHVDYEHSGRGRLA